MVESSRVKSKLATAIGAVCTIISVLGVNQLEALFPEYGKFIPAIVALATWYVSQSTENKRVEVAEQIVHEQYEDSSADPENVVVNLTLDGEDIVSNDDEVFEQAVLDESEQGTEEHEWLVDHMEQLSEDYRRVVLCIAGRNMSVRETAKHLGISEANVRKRYERAKKKLIQMREEIPEHQKKTGKGEDEYEGNQYRFTRYNG